MTYNWELFYRDPRGWEIPNQGVTKIGRPGDKSDWEVLKWELESFVCEGEYDHGLERILNTYLANLGNPEQAAAWVSGFYGSGKSHLVRMLASLWEDAPLPDGSTPRGLATLSEGVKDALVELSNAGKRLGGLWSATGKLGSGTRQSYRLAFLAILFDSAGLPPQYPAARLCMMLRREGVYDDVVRSLEKAEKDPKVEFLNLYVSVDLGQAVVDALPDFATDQQAARDIFRDQYPGVKDISDADTITVMTELLELQSNDGEIPCTVIVLDEIQAFIADDEEKRLQVENITELCSTNFDSKVMVVAAGQSALAASGVLSKMKDRFYLLVELSDQDVENVIRTLVLRKKPEMRDVLDAELASVSGEIDKHLNGTRIGARPADDEALVPDYPLLPVRRRLWEHVLRSIDRGGGSAQLRTQLRVTHDANQAVADNEPPSVVGADFVFFNQASGMLSGKVLSQEMHERIQDYKDGSDEGELRARVLALIFLISKLPSDEGSDLGIRTRPDHLSELLISDLKMGSGQLKPKVEAALKALESDGTVIDIDGEYRLQTSAGADLHRRYQERLAQIKNDASKMSHERDAELRRVVDNTIGGMRMVQGHSKTARRVDVSYTQDAPDTSGKDIPVWVRDEWSTSLGEFKRSAAAADVSDPTVFVFLPKMSVERLRDLIASSNAAIEVLDETPISDTPEGQEARIGLEARGRTARQQLEQLLEEISVGAKVWQAGGTVVDEGSLVPSVSKACEASLIRKFPKFKDADHPKWGTVVERAREGNENPLDQVGFTGSVADHPVCKAVLSFVSTPKKGSEVRSHFGAGEYGWPDDAINGTLLCLVNAGEIQARNKAGQQTSSNALRLSDISATTFSRESVPPLDTKQKIELRKTLADAGMSAEPGSELEGVAGLLQKMADMAERAGGDAPLPRVPDTALIGQLRQHSGNALLKEAYDSRKELGDKASDWKGRIDAISERSKTWELVQRLLAHADNGSGTSELEVTVTAIRDGRQLLDNPDPVKPVVEKLVDELRNELQSAADEYATALAVVTDDLRSLEEWKIIGGTQGEEVLQRHGLVDPGKPADGTPEELLASLDRTPLVAWSNRRDALPELSGKARRDLAELARPETEVIMVPLPKALLESKDDIDKYVEEIRHLLHTQLAENRHLSV